jgi:hypothetical protein
MTCLTEKEPFTPDEKRNIMLTTAYPPIGAGTGESVAYLNQVH